MNLHHHSARRFDAAQALRGRKLELVVYDTTRTGVARQPFCVWALDNVGVVQIDVLIDGQKVGEAIYNLSRPDIGAVWGSFPNAAHSGFSFQFDTTKLSSGDHTLAVRLLDAGGNSTIIGSRTITVQNASLLIATTVVPKVKKDEFYDFSFTAGNGRAPFS